MKNLKSKILFIGGHYNSTIATLDWLKEHSDFEFYWVGESKYSDGSITPEYQEVTKREIPFYDLKAGKLYRATNPKYFYKILYNLVLIPFGFINAFRILLKIKPNLIISFGGYQAVPLVLSGRLLGIKSITHEQTVVVGLSNSILSFFVKKIYTSWPVEYYDVSSRIKSKMIYTGLPMKKSTLESYDKIKFKRDLPAIYVTGGKKGSMFINQLVLKNLSNILEQVNLIWSCGSRKGVADYNEIKQSIMNLSQEHAGSVYLKEYFLEDEIGKVYKTADLVISRAGAHTIYELAVLKKPAIIIPLPITTHNEQVKNAKLLERMGVARIIYEDNFSNDEFTNIIQNMLRDLLKIQNNVTKDDTIDIELKGQENLGNEIIEILKN